MATMSMTVCDKCKDVTKRADTYTIEGGGRLSTLDLCAEDAKVLIEYQRLVPKPVVGPMEASRPRGARRNNGRASSRIVTMEELEKMKAKGVA